MDHGGLMSGCPMGRKLLFRGGSGLTWGNEEGGSVVFLKRKIVPL